jgi:hypothetical protein
MSKNESKIESLAVAVASGRKVNAWCEENHVPLPTAYRWSRTDEFRARVRELRQQMTDRVLGSLADAGVAAVDEIRRIMREGTQDPVRLSAARAILSEIVAYTEHSDTEARLAELEARVLKGDAGRHC